MTLVPELERSLVGAIVGQSPPRHGVRRRVLAVAGGVAALLGATAVALAATGVISIGSPVSSPAWVGPPVPTAGNGAIRPASSRLLAVRTPDPAGGLAWGMRITTTTRGLGCLEVGRIEGGILGVLGQDGAFGDDGRLHPLPAALSATSPECAALDGDGRLIYNVSVGEVPASGLNASALDVTGGCLEPGAHERGARFCSQRDERDLFYGVLGPQAASLTYTVGGTSHSLTLQPPYGAYLIVVAAVRASVGVSGSLYPHTPVTAVTYRSGLRCKAMPGGVPISTPLHSPPSLHHLPGRVLPAPTIAPDCRTPPGYAPVLAPQYTAAQVASPVSATVRSTGGRYEVVVSFTSRVAIANALSDYSVTYRDASGSLFGYTRPVDVRRGARVTYVLPVQRPVQRSTAGPHRGEVVFNAASAPGQQPPVPFLGKGPGRVTIVVGRFTFRIPGH